MKNTPQGINDRLYTVEKKINELNTQQQKLSKMKQRRKTKETKN